MLASILFPSMQQTGPRLGAEGMLRAYSTMPWLRSFFQKISEDVSSLTWTICMPTNAKGRGIRDRRLQGARTRHARTILLKQYAKDDQLIEIPNHPTLELLTAGNNYFAGPTVMQLSQTHLDLIGEMCWLLELNLLGMPVSAAPLPPTWIHALPEQTGGYYRVIGPTGTWEVPKELMFFAYHPNPANPYRRGTGIGQVLADELETDEYAARHMKDWFKNRAIPPVLISGLGVGLGELKRLEEKWLSKFQRQGAGWLPHFLGSDVKVHELSQTFAQQQLIELRKSEKEMIRQVIGIPPEQMGDITNSNRSTIDVSDFIYQSRVIVPRAEFLRSVLQEFLIPRFDERLVIDYISPVVEDREFMLKVRTAAPWGWTVDEWRELGMDDPLKNKRGEIHMLPFNLLPTPQNELTLDRPVPIPGGGGGLDGLPQPGTILGPAEPPALPESPIAAARARIKLVLAPAMRKELEPSEINDIAKASAWQQLVAAPKKILTAALEKFGQDAIDELSLDIAFNLADPRVVAHLRTWGADRMTLVNDTTKEAIRTTLADGVQNGESFDALVGRIRDVYTEASTSRAESIAGSELTRSSNFAVDEGLKQAGVEKKAWLSTQDGYVRDTHVELDGQVVGINENFVSISGAQGPYPGEMGTPEEDINCRCAVISVLASEASVGDMRTARWKNIEAERAPYVRRLTAAFRQGFAAQEQAVLARLEAYAGQIERVS